ncbi:heavy metal RND transporter [Lonsdalea populi]|uniref:Heavy metal RND transporter n=1 Tax=Lonsdalea populi TaxID=1172565 RepID=A0A3N0USE7_9GAMM|nr:MULTISPECIES: TolC family protein [Lonsdalea]RAT13791.1 heavy metal RND transporter [Lonsdalea quercina]RAT30329.1 heavy metal RND transporter [Lonsdalea populi]RAT31650.1 heavy metal RND transporter [Lonsdalea populi]RAT48896.1 heavy metal RND transporter [Lonsdalea populi]RAT50489.1 heavy metal RND transporter [Lonsdalea populi]
MFTQTLSAAGIALLLALGIGTTDAATLEQALAAAERYSAELSANQHQVSALSNMADAAMQLPDPKLKIGIENLPVSGGNAHRFTRSDMTMQRVGVMQDYVSHDKRERKAQTIRAEAAQVAAAKGVIRASLQQDTAQAWFELALAERTLAAVDRAIAQTERQLPAQTAGVGAGEATAAGVLDVRLTLSEMRSRRDNARSDIDAARARLRQLTGADIASATGAFPPIDRAPVDENVLLENVGLHPAVVQAAREAEVAGAKSAESAVAARPDVGVEVYFAKRADGLENMGGVMLTVDLPLFTSQRQDKAHAADISRAYEANDQLQLQKRAQRAQIATLFSQYRAAKSIFERQTGEVLPLLSDRVRLMDAQFRAGGASLAEVLEARRAQLNGEIDRLSAEKTLASRWAALRYQIPQDITQ